MNLKFNPGDWVYIKPETFSDPNVIAVWNEEFIKWYHNLSPKKLQIKEYSRMYGKYVLYSPGYNTNGYVFIKEERLMLFSDESPKPMEKPDYMKLIRQACGRG